MIFDSKLGFGGDGDPKAEKYKHAHCVTDTPFKGLKPQWAGSDYDPHCLTRSFNDDDWVGHYVNPESLAEIMNSTTYEEFYLALEMKAHDIIPTGVRGDFMAFTAPNGSSASRQETALNEMLTDLCRRSNILSPSRATRPDMVALADAGSTTADARVRRHWRSKQERELD